MKYRKKPVVIEAFQFGFDATPDWFTNEKNLNNITTHYVNEKYNKGDFHFECLKDADIYCVIKTLEGEMRGNKGDYIIRGVRNEIYPCREDIFLATYEKVKE